jgi:hypothetical protein
MKFSDFLRPDRDSFQLEIACGSREPIWYRISSDCSWLQFSQTYGETTLKDIVTVSVDRSMLKGKEEGIFYVEGNNDAKVIITVEAEQPVLSAYAPMTFVEYDNYIAMEADHYAAKGSVGEAGFVKLSPYGITGTAMKVYPSTADFLDAIERPWLEYHFVAKNDGEYDAAFYMAPTSPVDNRQYLYIGTQINDESVKIDNTLWYADRPYFYGPQWSKEAHDNVKVYHRKINCKKGVNSLRFYNVSPNILLERIVLHPEESKLPESYLGPEESFCCM